MKNKIIAVILSICLLGSALAGCGTSQAESEGTATAENEAVNTADQGDEQETTEEEEPKEETESEAASEGDDTWSELEAIGNVDVDKGLFDVTLTIPKDFVGETTQEELDDMAKEKGYQSITLNSDGSATYVMTKAQHKELVDGVTQSLNESLAEMVGSEEYPNITAAEANDDFTVFTITTKNTETDLAEAMSVLVLYTYGGMYAIFSGDKVDNIHVDFVNDESGNVIDSYDSKNMGE